MTVIQDRLILDLCGGTGAWSQPYKDAGYNVKVITEPDWDVRLFHYVKTKKVHGVLAAPPCDHFSGSGAQYWEAKDEDGRTLEGIAVVDACIRTIFTAKPVWWCLENPIGRLKYWLGDPIMYFDPWEYGDPYTKRTCLWGRFNPPKRKPVTPVRSCEQGSWLQKLGGTSEKTKRLRSMTPTGFAKAFFKANP